MTSLRDTAVTGVKWTTASATFAAVTALLFQLIKARFLVPEEFAYLAILMIVIGLSRNLEAAGFNRGVIQRDLVTVEEASSLLILNVLLSFFASLIIYYSGAPVAAFFELPRLDIYLRIISLAVFFQGLTHFFVVFLEKHFHFKVIATIQIIRQFLFVVLAAILIVLGWGVLGFVLGHVLATIISAVLFVGGGLNNRVAVLKPHFRLNDLRPFIKFGIFVTGRQTLSIITRQLDELIVHHFLGPEIMGVYFFGKNMLERLRQLLYMSFYRLVFPLLSRIKHDQLRLSEAYYKMNRYVALVTFPVFIGVALTAHLFVPVIFGEQWTDSILIFQVFSVTLVFKMLTGTLAGNLLYSINRPGTVFGIDVATDLVYIFALMIFASWGINTVIILYTIYQLIKFMAMQIAAHRYLSFQLHYYFLNIKGPAGLSLFMAAAVGGFIYFVTPLLSPVFLLGGSIAVGASTYFLLTWAFDQKSIQELKDMALKKRDFYFKI